MLEFLKALGNLLSPLAQLAAVFLQGPIRATKALGALGVLVVFVLAQIYGATHPLPGDSFFLRYYALLAPNCKSR